MKRLVILILMIYSSFVGATQQMEEWLDLGSVRFDIDEYPLESHPNYEMIVKDIGSSMCSASWRGYQGIWAIGKGKLYLTHLYKNPCSDMPEDYLDPKDLTGVKGSDGIAVWYTGTITFRISRRTFLDKASEGLRGVTYEAVVYEILNGEVTSREVKQVQRLRQ